MNWKSRGGWWWRAIVFLGSNALEESCVSWLIKTRVREDVLRHSNAFVGTLPPPEWPPALRSWGQKVDGCVLVGKCTHWPRSGVLWALAFLLTLHGYQPEIRCQNLAPAELSQWNTVLLDFLLPRYFNIFFFSFFFNPPHKPNQVAPSRAGLSLQIHYCNLQMTFTLYAPDNNCINISW